MTTTLVAFALLVVACSSGSSNSGRNETQGTMVTTPPAQVTTAQLISSLAGVGVPVFRDARASQPIEPTNVVGPLKLLEWQVANLARESSAGGGYAGAELDTLTPMPKGAPPMSYLLAAYVQTATTEGAELSRSLMGTQNWRQAPAIVFPNIVLALFANDAASPNPARTTAPAKPATAAPDGPRRAEPIAVESGLPSPAGPARPALDDTPTGICSSLSGWVNDMLTALFNALKVDTSDAGIGGFLGEVWNAAVTLAQGLVEGLITVLTAPVLAIITQGLAILGTLATAAALLHPATVTIASQPDPIDYGIDPNPGNVGVFTANVKTGASDWPADLLDCAHQAGVTLPDPGSLKGSPVTWQTSGFPAVGNEEKHDSALDGAGTATLTYRTNTETKEAAEQGTPIYGVVTAQIRADRNDVKDIQTLLSTLLFNVIPGPASQIVSAIFSQLISPVFDELAQLVAVVGSGTAIVVHHGPPPTQPKGPGTTTCAGSGTGVIPDGTWTGPITMDAVGEGNVASGAVRSTGAGTVTMTVQNGKVVSGTWAQESDSSGTVTVKGGSGTIRSMHVSITNGTVSGTASAPVVTGSATMNGVIDVTAGGFSTSVPINESGTATATMTVQQAECAEVIATFIPSFNQTAGGVVSFSGTATWTGSAG